jgi:hypothetical protein
MTPIRNRSRLVFGLSIAVLGGLSSFACEPCDLDSNAEGCAEAGKPGVPRIATVELQGAVIGPGKVTRETWDASGEEIPTDVWSQLATALAGSNPYTAVAALLVNPVLAGTKAPDPFGTARLDVGPTIGMTVMLPEANMEDTYTPSWSSVIWTGVPLDRDVRLKVDLTDEDLLNHDPIGSAEINTSHLLEALAARTAFHVPVANQSRDQLLFLKVSVRE